jgi:hypothetical protein
MVLSTAKICAFGWKARDFALKGVDGKTYSLADVRGPMGTLVAAHIIEPKFGAFQIKAEPDERGRCIRSWSRAF